MEIIYSNPDTTRTFQDWPYGSMRTTAMFYVETDPKRGERAVRRTVNPRNGTLGEPKKLTFAHKMRIVDGSDGRTYVAALHCGSHITIFQSNMQFQQEAIFPGNERYQKTLALFNQEAL